MPTYDQVLQKLTQLINLVNAINNNAKKIDELPSQDTLDVFSKIHVSKNGTSEKINIKQILDVANANISVATDPETQIVAVVAEDRKIVSRLKLFNWWNWLKSLPLKWNNTITTVVGNTDRPPLIIPSGVLTTLPQNGALEADPSNLYYTAGGIRYPILAKYLYDGGIVNFIKWIYPKDKVGSFTEQIFLFPETEKSWFSLGGNRILFKSDLFIDRNTVSSNFKVTSIRVVLTSVNKKLSINVGTFTLIGEDIIIPLEWEFSLLQRGYYFYLICKYKNYANLSASGAVEETKIARLNGFSTAYDWGNVAWTLKFFMDYKTETVTTSNQQVFVSYLTTRRIRIIL